MLKIKDRILLGVIAGLAGNTVKTIIDEISLKQKISQRSFRNTAAGVWVTKKSEVTNINGQILGGLLDFGMATLGGIGTVYMLTKTGRDHIITKGLISGIGMGSSINFVLGTLPQNQIRPKDAASNLSYMLSHAVYGLITTFVVAKLGHPSLYSRPINNYLEPSESTTEQTKNNS